MALSVDDVIDKRYKVLKHLGQGGLGDVYLAEDQVLARKVAIKHLQPGSAREQADVEHFLAEARTIAQVHHENVVAIYDVIEEGGDYYLVMEYADEGSVADLLRQEGRLPVLRALELGLDVARVLEAVHAQGLLHGDIKPSNIMLVSSPGGVKVKLADFGLSWVTTQPETDQATFSGSLLYSAPEQLCGKAIDRRADLYALGAVLYEMLTDQPPFPCSGEREDVGRVIRSHLEASPVPPGRLNPDVLPAVDKMILKLLSKVPDERYADASALEHALRQAIEEHQACQQRVQAARAQGIEHERRGEWEQAIACYQAILAEQPGHAEAQAWLAQAQEQQDWKARYQEGLQAYGQGQWAEAERILEQVIAHDANYAGGDAATKLKEAQRQRELAKLYEDGRDHEAHERWSDAADCYLKILTLAPDYAEKEDVSARLAYAVRRQKQQTLYNKAREHMAAEAWTEAVKTLQELERLGPGYKDSAALLDEARRQKQLNELYVQALQALNRGEWASAIDSFNQVLRLEPEYKDAAVKRAVAERQERLANLYRQTQAHMEAEEWAAAVTALQEVKEIAPSYQDVDRLLEEAVQKQRIEEIYQEGIQFSEQEEWAQAIQRWEAVKRLQPGYRDVEQRLEKAQRDQRIDALYAQARLLEMEEKWTEAIGVYSEIIRLDPNHRDAKVGLRRVSAAALGREQPLDVERRDRSIAIVGALLAIAALSCMLFLPPQRIARIMFPLTTASPAQGAEASLTLSPTESEPFVSPVPTTTSGVVVSEAPTAMPTPIPTDTPTLTPPLTPTWTPSPTLVPHIEIVSELTIPNRPTWAPGTHFTKTWVLTNTRSPLWPEGATLIFVGGTQMGGPNERRIEPLPTTTEAVTVSIPLVAPASDGEYEGIWQIQDAGGNPISEEFYAKVIVRKPPPPTPTYSPLKLGGVSIIGCNVIFKWEWPGTLAEDEYFAVRAWREGIDPHESVTWTKGREYTHIPCEKGDYTWEVAICRGDPGTHICEQLAVNKGGTFWFGGDKCCVQIQITETIPP